MMACLVASVALPPPEPAAHLLPHFAVKTPSWSALSICCPGLGGGSRDGGVSQKVSLPWSISTLSRGGHAGTSGRRRTGGSEGLALGCGPGEQAVSGWMNQQGGVVQRHQEGMSYGPDRGS